MQEKGRECHWVIAVNWEKWGEGTKTKGFGSHGGALSRWDQDGCL